MVDTSDVDAKVAPKSQKRKHTRLDVQCKGCITWLDQKFGANQTSGISRDGVLIPNEGALSITTTNCDVDVEKDATVHAATKTGGALRNILQTTVEAVTKTCVILRMCSAWNKEKTNFEFSRSQRRNNNRLDDKCKECSVQKDQKVCVN